MYLRWILLQPVSILASIFGLIFNPLIALAAREDGTLPDYLIWLGTLDNTLDGDDGWKLEHRPFMNESNKFRRWVNRTFWLYRNNMYGFAERVLGFQLPQDYIYTCLGSEEVGNRPLQEGSVKRLITLRDRTYWHFYYVKAWTPTMCLRVNIGWKLWGEKKPGNYYQMVLSINPFMGYSRFPNINTN